ncbi:hypothetical protein [Roseateles amylovorans]|uniref:TRAM domain-containing protein n=1 Tax=Roseateles amylovorans TaxID=2978473 RepID=A0ABY6B6R8_9BURK|nr:hypothetical protein [Roseateles amylovorans]UXH80456.1 hypothetical protein N4261_11530 [Roseateles amylovorans]
MRPARALIRQHHHAAQDPANDKVTDAVILSESTERPRGARAGSSMQDRDDQRQLVTLGVEPLADEAIGGGGRLVEVDAFDPTDSFERGDPVARVEVVERFERMACIERIERRFERVSRTEPMAQDAGEGGGARSACADPKACARHTHRRAGSRHGRRAGRRDDGRAGVIDGPCRMVHAAERHASNGADAPKGMVLNGVWLPLAS